MAACLRLRLRLPFDNGIAGLGQYVEISLVPFPFGLRSDGSFPLGNSTELSY